MSHAVLRRTGEIGLRMALGALPAHVLRMILRESSTLVGLGILTGTAAAYAAPDGSSVDAVRPVDQPIRSRMPPSRSS